MNKQSFYFLFFIFLTSSLMTISPGCSPDTPPQPNSPSEDDSTSTEAPPPDAAPEEPEVDVADPPKLFVLNSIGDEETPIELFIDAALSDTDGSEEISVEICNFPEGSAVSLKGFCRANYNAQGAPVGNNETFDECALELTSPGLAPHREAIPVNGVGSCLTIDNPTLEALEKPERVDDCSQCPGQDTPYDPVCTTLADGRKITYRNPCEATQCADVENDDWTVGTCEQAITITPARNWISTEHLLVTVTTTETSTGETAKAMRNIRVTAKSVNDAPSLSGEFEGVVQLEQNGTFSFGAMVTDPDWDEEDPAATLTLTIETELGRTSVLAPSGLTWEEGMENGQPTMQFHCSLPRCNEALASITYQAPTDYIGSDSITTTVNDNGHSGDDDTPQTDTKTLTVEIN